MEPEPRAHAGRGQSSRFAGIEAEQTAGGSSAPSEEELQRRLEEQMRTVRVQDLLLESVAGIINLSARRIAKEDERDLEQARVGIEAVRAVLDLLEPGPRAQVQEALSRVQMLYAREAQGARGPGEAAAEQASPPGPEEGPRGQPPPRRGEEPPPRLWTPPGSS